MKIIFFTLLIFHIFTLQLRAQDSTALREELKKVNQELIADYRAGKNDEALILAQKATGLSISLYGAESSENASAFRNLGLVYLAKKKYKDAALNLRKAVDFYNLNPDKYLKETAKTLDQLALALALDGNKDEAEKNYVTALTTAEKAFGSEGKELVSYLNSMAQVFILVKKYDEAQQNFIRAYNLGKKSNLPDADLQAIEDSFNCFSTQYFGYAESVERRRKFSEAIAGKEEKPAGRDSVDGGVINGKAKELAKPAYPSAARERHAQGIILVRVLIDESGKVVEAKSLCGDPDLRAASEDAARRSKFSPTTLSGAPVKVSGIITYNFVP